MFRSWKLQKAACRFYSGTVDITAHQTSRFSMQSHVPYKINDCTFQGKPLTNIFFCQCLCKWKRKALPDTTWIKLKMLAKGSVHSTTKLKKSRSMWNGAQQMAKTITRTTGVEKGEKKNKSEMGRYGSPALWAESSESWMEDLKYKLYSWFQNIFHPFCLTITN